MMNARTIATYAIVTFLALCMLILAVHLTFQGNAEALLGWGVALFCAGQALMIRRAIPARRWNDVRVMLG